MDSISHQEHPPYLLVGLALIVLTILEIVAVYTPQVPTLFALLVLGGTKALLIAMYFMHLKFDRRMYTFLFTIGIALGIAMVWVLFVLIQSHS